MKTITIRQLHKKTGEYIRKAAETGEIYVTDRGKTVARIVPEYDQPGIPYFARRHLTPAFRKLANSGKLRRGPDSKPLVLMQSPTRPSSKAARIGLLR